MIWRTHANSWSNSWIEIDSEPGDVRSDNAKEVNHKLERLDLPTLPDLRDEFEELCQKLDVD